MIKNDQLDNFQTFLYGLNSSINKTEKHFSLAQKISDNIGSASSSWKLQELDFQLVSGRDKLAAYIQDGATIHQGVLNGFIIYFFYNIQKDFPENVQKRANQLKRLEGFFSFINSAKTKDTEPNQTKRLIDYILKKIELPTLKSEIDLKWNLQFFKNDNGKWTPLFLKNNVQRFNFPNIENFEKQDVKIEEKTSFINDKRLLVGLIVVTILIVGYFGYNYINQQHKLKEQTLEEERILSNATMLHSGYANQLNQLYASIEAELKSQEKTISKTTIGKIISLSDNLKPYRYLHNQKLLEQPLSRERADLFRYLMQLDLPTQNYRDIFDKANFSYGDFSNLDLSNIDIICLIEGIDGHHGKNAQLLITTFNRPNFKGSVFENCNLSGAKLYGDFSKADFSKATIMNTIFNWSKGIGSDFSGSKRVIQIINSDFKNANFQDNTIYGSFVDSDLRGVNFNNSSFLPYYVYNDSYTDIKTIGDKPIDIYLEKATFHNTFLGSKEIYTRYRSFGYEPATINTIRKNRNLAKSFFVEEYQTPDGSWTYNTDIMPIELFLSPKQKEIAILHKDFKFIGNNYVLDTHIKHWKNQKTSFIRYVVRTNEDYYQSYVTKGFLNYFVKDTVVKSSDTIFINSGKDFYCYRYPNADVMTCPERVAIENAPIYASFENCKFYNISFSTKIKGISFKGSGFQKTYFKDSRLYDIDMTHTKGDIYIDKTTQIDSILIDKTHFLNRLENEKLILLGSKVPYPVMANDADFNKEITFEAYLKDNKINRLPLAVFGKTNDIKIKYDFISDMENRLIIKSTKDQFYIKDSLYLKSLDFKKSQKNKSP